MILLHILSERIQYILPTLCNSNLYWGIVLHLTCLRILTFPDVQVVIPKALWALFYRQILLWPYVNAFMFPLISWQKSINQLINYILFTRLFLPLIYLATLLNNYTPSELMVSHKLGIINTNYLSETTVNQFLHTCFYCLFSTKINKVNLL